MAPEAEAREEIDRQLAACGWAVQDYAALNLSAAPSAQTIGFFNRNLVERYTHEGPTASTSATTSTPSAPRSRPRGRASPRNRAVSSRSATAAPRTQSTRN